MLKLDKIAAFREIYERYWTKLYADAYKRVRNREQTEEILQDIFTTLWVKRQELAIRSTLGGYLHTALIHQVVDHYRKELVRERYREAFKIVHKDADNSTEEAIMLKELVNTIETEISHLPDRCRSVYELSRKEHKTNKEIALVLGISEKTVENQLTKALKHLRTGLGNYMWLMAIIFLK